MLNTYPPTPTYHCQLGIQTPQVILCVSIHLCERRALDQQETTLAYIGQISSLVKNHPVIYKLLVKEEAT